MQIDKVIVHCSATPSDMDIGADVIREWHTIGNGWKDIGYHYVIRRDGSTENGRDMDGDGNVEDEIGAHAKGFNRSSIGICLVGGTDSDSRRDAEANYTYAQYSALVMLVQQIKGRHGTDVEVIGHRDLNSAKACPCFDVRSLFSRIG
ncbi:MAG: N-acetylmuramoyl-L-alanine amidase [Candidatus Sedimenticola sp. (ex Thyasira tokunagai)]